MARWDRHKEQPNLINLLLNADDLLKLVYLGEERKYAASSCREIAERKPNASSGYYYIDSNSNGPFIAYCELEREFIPNTRGWMRLKLLNMSDPNEMCPGSGLEVYRSVSRRQCRRINSSGGCTYFPISNPLLWRHMCGRVVAYSERTLDGWRRWGSCPSPCTPDYKRPYVDGVSIIAQTGHNKYTHIWSSLPSFGPPSTNPKPEFVGNNCDDQMSSNDYWFCTTRSGDPLYPNQFYNVYAGICRDQSRADEDVLLQHVELYVR